MKEKPLITSTCLYCGKEFTHYNVAKIYCSMKCQNAANYAARHKKTCAICGRKFIAREGKIKYCSDECRAIALKEQNERKHKQQNSQYLSTGLQRTKCHDCGKPTNGTYRCQSCKMKFLRKHGYTCITPDANDSPYTTSFSVS